VDLADPGVSAASDGVADFSGSDFTSAGVFLSENISATSVQINIHNASTLHRFQATKRGDWRIQPLTAFACDAAVPVLAARHRIFDTLILHRHRLLLLTSNDKTLPLSLPDSLLDHKDELPRHLASTLSMGLDADSPMGDAHARRVRSIVHSFDSTASIQFDGGETARISVDYRIRDNLVHQCLEAIAWSLSPDAVFAIKRELLLSRRADSQMHDQEDAWDAFVYALKSALGVGVVDRQSVAAAVDDPILRKLATRVKDKRKDPQASNTPRQTARSPEFDRASLAKILYSLHIVAQDYRLAQSLSRDLEKVASLVIDLCHAAGQLDWLDYWSRLMPGYNADPAPATCEQWRPTSRLIPVSDWDMSPLVDAAQPPDIIAYLSRRLLTPLEPFPVPADSVDDAQPQPACHAIQTIIAIYDRLAIAADQPNDPRGRAESIIRRGGAVIAYMIAHNLDHAYINDLPVGVAMPILEVMRACQAGPDKGWTPEMYDFVGRSDLAAQARGISIPSRDRDDMVCLFL
jgi:anaphase-promoting complex subunit 1